MHLIIEIEMSPKQLHEALLAGETVEAPEFEDVGIYASARKIDNTFVLWGASGVHRLNVTFTDPERLHAHWTGFKAIALSIARSKLKEVA